MFCFVWNLAESVPTQNPIMNNNLALLWLILQLISQRVFGWYFFKKWLTLSKPLNVIVVVYYLLTSFMLFVLLCAGIISPWAHQRKYSWEHFWEHFKLSETF